LRWRASLGDRPIVFVTKLVNSCIVEIHHGTSKNNEISSASLLEFSFTEH